MHVELTAPLRTLFADGFRRLSALGIDGQLSCDDRSLERTRVGYPEGFDVQRGKR